LLRRAGAHPAEQQTYADPLVTIDFAQREVRYRESETRLTPLEFRLLATFVRHRNQVLEPRAPHSTPIETVRGFGYRYRPR
jgi:DNA-binding response OmpR family regulator